MLTHRNLVANAFPRPLRARSRLGRRRGPRRARAVPVPAIAPLVSLGGWGAGFVTIPSWRRSSAMSTSIERSRATVIMPVPTMMAALVAAQRTPPRERPRSGCSAHAGSPVAKLGHRGVRTTPSYPARRARQFYGARRRSRRIVTCLRARRPAIGTRVSDVRPCRPGVAVQIRPDDGTRGERVGGKTARSVSGGRRLPRLNSWGQPRSGPRGPSRSGWLPQRHVGVSAGGATFSSSTV